MPRSGKNDLGSILFDNAMFQIENAVKFAGSIPSVLKSVSEVVGKIADPITDAFGNERVNVRLETTVDRTAFGINWNRELPSGVPALGNDVKITANLALVQA